MNCADAKQAIMEYLDGELPGEERVALEEHLAECDACTRELAELRRLVARVKALPKVPAPPGLAPRIAAAIDAETYRRAGWRPWIKRYGAMAASIAIVVVAAAIWTKSYKSPLVDGGLPSRKSEAEKRPAEEEFLQGSARSAPGSERQLTEHTDLAKGKTTETEFGSTAGMKGKVEGGAAQIAGEDEVYDLAVDALKDEPLAAATDEQLFDIVIEADSPSRCVDDLADFLEKCGVNVVARISSRRSIILAEVVPSTARGKQDKHGEGRAPAGRLEIIRRIAASGKFRLVRLGGAGSASAVDVAYEPHGPAPIVNDVDGADSSRAADGKPARGGRRPMLAILVVNREVLEPAATKDKTPENIPTVPQPNTD